MAPPRVAPPERFEGARPEGGAAARRAASRGTASHGTATGVGQAGAPLEPAPPGSAALTGTTASPSRHGRLGDDDLHYFNEGTHGRLYDRLGCHLRAADAA